MAVQDSTFSDELLVFFDTLDIITAFDKIIQQAAGATTDFQYLFVLFDNLGAEQKTNICLQIAEVFSRVVAYLAIMHSSPLKLAQRRVDGLMLARSKGARKYAVADVMVPRRFSQRDWIGDEFAVKCRRRSKGR